MEEEGNEIFPGFICSALLSPSRAGCPCWCSAAHQTDGCKSAPLSPSCAGCHFKAPYNVASLPPPHHPVQVVHVGAQLLLRSSWRAEMGVGIRSPVLEHVLHTHLEGEGRGRDGGGGERGGREGKKGQWLWTTACGDERMAACLHELLCALACALHRPEGRGERCSPPI